MMGEEPLSPGKTGTHILGSVEWLSWLKGMHNKFHAKPDKRKHCSKKIEALILNQVVLYQNLKYAFIISRIFDCKHTSFNIKVQYIKTLLRKL